MSTYNCLVCSKEFKDKPSRNRMFCSRKCAGIYRSIHYIGKKHHLWKPKILKICPICGETFFVPQCRGDSAVCCSTTCQYKYISITYRGKNSVFYNGYSPVYNLVEYKEFVKRVYKRDNYTCQLCGTKHSRKNRLESHHIYPKRDYPELIYNIDNNITLCKECHSYFTKCEIHFIDFFERLQDYRNI